MKFILTLIGSEGDWADVTPAELQADMARWEAISKELVDAGAYIAGEALQESSTAKTARIVDGGERVVADGPYAESKEQLGGFYLLECANIDEAVEWAKKMPLSGGDVEVRPVADYSEYDSGGSETAAAAEAS